MNYTSAQCYGVATKEWTGQLFVFTPFFFLLMRGWWWLPFSACLMHALIKDRKTMIHAGVREEPLERLD